MTFGKLAHRHLGLCYLLGLILMSGQSCTEQPDPEVIDQTYLESSAYSDFESSYRQEARQLNLERKELSEIISYFFDCQKIPELELPLRFNRHSLNQLVKTSKSACGADSLMERASFTLYPLGRTVFAGITIFWSLLDHRSYYEDEELIAATFSGRFLQSYRKIGMYEDNLSRNITSEIKARVSEDVLKIMSNISRKITYPIEQQNSTILNFEIDRAGDIREIR